MAKPLLRNVPIDQLRVSIESNTGIDRASLIDLRKIDVSAYGESLCYRLVVGNRDYFLRISCEIGDISLEKRIIGAISDDSLVNPAIFSWQEVFGHNLETTCRVDVTRFIEGHHYMGDLDELREISEGIALIHKDLQKSEVSDLVRVNSVNKSNDLEIVKRDAIRAVESRKYLEWKPFRKLYEDDADWIIAVLDGSDPAYWDGELGQPLHGEIHIGNVLLREEDHRPVFIDWNESVHSYGKVSWDIAWIIQRFCLHDDPSIDQIEKRFQVVEMGYGTNVEDVFDSLMQISSYSLLKIFRSCLMGEFWISPLEVKKFQMLHEQGKCIEVKF